MYKIIIKGDADTEYPNLSKLNGISCEDNFAEYFDDDFSFIDNINEGYLKFEYNKDENKLYSITEYFSNRELSNDELEILKDYTQGQWSDGIGEGFEQIECFTDDDENEVYISPWHRDQIITITQTIL